MQLGHEKVKLIARGAEADVYLIDYWGCKAIMKVRRPKPYRHPKVDIHIREERTRNEARTMLRAFRGGVSVPKLYDVDYRDMKIIMEFIDGKPLYEVLREEYLREAGSLLALLHSLNVAHWDYTTANILVKDDKLYIIDFGLARYTEDDLEKAVDIHLMIRSFLSAHPGKEDWVRAFWEGYAKYGDVNKMKELVRQIELMGRYVKDRRRTVW